MTDEHPSDGWEAELELALSEQMGEVRPTVRHDCSFCGRERSPKDDNHAPDCPYWFIGPGGLR